MHLGRTALSQVPLGMGAHDASLPDPLLDLLDAPDLQWLMRVVGWDDVAGAEEEVYVSSAGYATIDASSARGVGADQPFPSGLKTSDNVEAKVYANGRFLKGAVAGFGSVRIATGDGRHKRLLELHLENRRVDFWVGRREWIGPQIDRFADRYVATVAGIDSTLDETTLKIRDLGHLFKKDSNPRAFLGFGVAVRMTSAAGAYVELPHDPLLEPDELGVELMVDIPPADAADGYLADKGGALGYQLEMTSKGAFLLRDRGATNVIDTGPGAYTYGEPSRVSFFADASGLRILVDGVEAASNSTPYGSPKPGGVMRVGEGLLGVVDDLRIWRSGMLPDADYVQRVARRELAAVPVELAGYYKFSTGTGTVAFNEVTDGATPDGALVGGGGIQWVGFEGTPSLAGKRVPRVRGYRRQLPGVLEDPQRLVYRVNLGSTRSILPLQNGMDSLAFGGDFDNIYDAVTAAGFYYTSLATGRCRFHDTFPGTITFNVEGDDEGGYVSTPADIMRRYAQEAGFTSQIEETALRTAAAARPGVAGIDTGLEPVSFKDVLDPLAQTMDGWHLVESGFFSVGLRIDPETAKPGVYLGVDDVVRGSVRSTTSQPPTRQYTVRYREHGFVHKLEETGGALTEEERDDLTLDWRSIDTPDLERVAEAHEDARRLSVDTLWDDPIDAALDGDRRLAIDEVPRRSISLTLRSRLNVPRIGTVVHLTLPLKGLENGQKLLVVGWKRSSGSLPGLVLWGKK